MYALGFAALFVGTVLVFIDEDFYRVITGSKFIQGNFYLGMSFILDLLGLLALLGLVIAIVRRYVFKPSSLSTEWIDTSFLLWVLAVLATGFLAEGARIGVVLTHKPNGGFEESSFVGYALAGVFGNRPPLHQTLWSIHILLSFGFIAMIPYTKGRHIFSSLFAIYTRNHWLEKLDKKVLPSTPRTACEEKLTDKRILDIAEVVAERLVE